MPQRLTSILSVCVVCILRILRYKYLIWGILIFSSCNQKRQSTLTESIQPAAFVDDSYVYYPITDNRIKVDLNKLQEASLFDYFSHIELIPLETRDDVLIAGANEIIQYQDRYYVFDARQYRIFVFDDAGKFIFQINKRGRGPGEYTHINNIFLNPFTGNIDVIDQTVIHSYDLTGKHVKTLPPIANPLVTPFNLIALNEKTYVFYSPLPYRPSIGPYKISYYDIEENKVFRQEYETDIFFNGRFLELSSFFPPRFYEYNGKWFFLILLTI